MRKMLETEITNKILKYLNDLDCCEARKQHGGPYAQRGEPDIDCVYRSVSLKLEVKTEKGKVSKLQTSRIEKWRKAGAVACVVRSVEDASRMIEFIDAMKTTEKTMWYVKIANSDSDSKL